MKQQVTTSIQDYLKNIYDLTKGGVPASTNDLAKRLDIKPGSVTGMVQKLASARPALVQYHKHQGVTLTAAGKKNALEVIRHHRLLETWLVQTLGYSWDEVHEEACRLEHVISEDFERRIAAALGHPTRDPHGDLIPTENLIMPTDSSQPLSALRPHQTGTIVRVNGEEPAFLRHLESLGLVPGAKIEAMEHSPFDHNLTVKIGNKSTVLGLAITSKVYVEI
ncbi:MAG: metal-dependent transcriptional regulator [Chloroflexota bacterium]